MSPELAKAYVDSLIQVAKWISYLILLGGSLSLAVIILRIFGKDQFKIGGFELPLPMFPYVVAGLTIAHAFLTWVFVQRVPVILSLGDENIKIAWARLTGSEAFVFYNMKPRVLASAPWPFKHAYFAQVSDTAFWFTVGIVFLFLGAAVASQPSASNTEVEKYSPVGGIRNVGTFDVILVRYFKFNKPYVDRVAIGCALACANWIIGSQWAMAASSIFR